MKELWELFIVFAKIGGFTFGGGYAMLPILQREVVENRNWATSEELMDYYAIGQCTPGIIAVNTATFIGYKRKGIIGGIVATIGCVFPSLVIIMIIAAFINSFTHIVWVQHALAGIRVCVCVLVLDAVIKLAKKSLIDAATYLICDSVTVYQCCIFCMDRMCRSSRCDHQDFDGTFKSAEESIGGMKYVDI